jgi:hypothetical protein
MGMFGYLTEPTWCLINARSELGTATLHMNNSVFSRVLPASKSSSVLVFLATEIVDFGRMVPYSGLRLSLA